MGISISSIWLEMANAALTFSSVTERAVLLLVDAQHFLFYMVVEDSDKALPLTVQPRKVCSVFSNAGLVIARPFGPCFLTIV